MRLSFHRSRDLVCLGLGPLGLGGGGGGGGVSSICSGARFLGLSLVGGALSFFRKKEVKKTKQGDSSMLTQTRKEEGKKKSRTSASTATAGAAAIGATALFPAPSENHLTSGRPNFFSSALAWVNELFL